MNASQDQDPLEQNPAMTVHGRRIARAGAKLRIQVPIDYLGFTIEDRFVVGYGLDWAEKYRNLPSIRVVEGG